jgi:F-type H+-transporting ATPase subunit epsilon
MATSQTFKLSVVTPERAALETDATFVAFPAWDGEIGIMAGRSPLLVRLGIGRLRAETPEGEKILFVDRGVAQMVDDRLTVLTEEAKEPSEIDVEAARAELQEAQGWTIGAEHDYTERDDALRRAKAQIAMAPPPSDF